MPSLIYSLRRGGHVFDPYRIQFASPLIEMLVTVALTHLDKDGAVEFVRDRVEYAGSLMNDVFRTRWQRCERDHTDVTVFTGSVTKRL